MSSPRPTRKQAFIIGVAGGTASGKTTVCDRIVADLADKRVVTISLDSFYRVLNQKERLEVENEEFNFDHPDAFDWDLTLEIIEELKKGHKATVPKYDFVTHSRVKDEGVTITNADVILFEGILNFYHPTLRDMMDLKIFVDTDSDLRLARRVIRDVKHRGRDVNGVLKQYETFVKPAFDKYVLPTKKYADVILPRGADNQVAINLIVQNIKALYQLPSPAELSLLRKEEQRLKKVRSLFESFPIERGQSF